MVPAVAEFLSHQTVQQDVSASTQNHAFSALIFLHAKVLGRPLGELEAVERARRTKKVPVELTRAKARALLLQLEGVELIMASLLHGSGLRVLEMLHLRVKDVDFRLWADHHPQWQGRKGSHHHAAQGAGRAAAAASGAAEAGV